jgi:hypothetical protein
MLRFSWLPCGILGIAFCACSSSDSTSPAQPAWDSGSPSQDAQPDTTETPEAAPAETGPEAESEAGEQDVAAADSPEELNAEAAAGTKKAGELCTEAFECADTMNCVSGQYTPAHCNPNCTSDTDCATSAPNAKGTCQNGGSINFCLYLCGVMGGGATCPGDLKCDGAVCG